MAGRILVIEDDKTLNELIVMQLGRAGYRVDGVTRWSDATRYLGTHEPALIIVDGKLPDADGLEKLPEIVSDYPVVVLTAYGSVRNAVEAIKIGAADYLLKPVSPEELLLTVKRTLEVVEIRNDHDFCKQQLKAKASRGSLLIGTSAPLREVQRLITAVAPDDISVLVQGESGTGKELIAREIHDQSNRADRHFVAVDCCTLQEKLFESELFGHERGAFTGADRQKKGLIEGAEGGTLFLDEIGEIGAAIQAKLLRVLETGIFRRLGGTKDLQANVRIVAATNRDLESMVAGGEFRADLYYRLNGFNILMPPLRERREDIPALAGHFIDHHNFSRRIEKQLSPPAVRKLTAYDWPGNVRELKNVIERAIILSGPKGQIQPEHLAFGSSTPNKGALLNLTFDHEPSMGELEESYLRYLLKKHSGRRTQVAELMGISERNIYRLIKRYGLEEVKTE
ncbi:MAG: sigma-54 dependent transcriptional regulator [Gammaproteobacteria bacterium]|nr:sigma-54 dependent transcriptional regulator [Gammaproteobacteria bacterium]MBU1653821.1 sigma-54 dependent transcriptional regulator [Gammaproteobacteria bacterium]MBU1962149.1 sigma-54 dependent transcriptional regulator [Gammaproteobacteria bacterium]